MIYGVIYKAVNRFNGFTYIGQTRNFEERRLAHLAEASLKSSNLFNYDLAKYGGDIRFEIVCYCLSQETMDFLEALLINHYVKRNRSYNSVKSARYKIKKELKDG